MSATMSGIGALIETARAARANAYAPYSRFAVGAAIRAEDGKLYAGANVENAAYPEGQCAETSAIGAMIAAGARHIEAMVVLADGDALCAPCGGCRQRIREFAEPTTEIHLCGPDGVRRTVTVGELLPLSFGPENLKGPER